MRFTLPLLTSITFLAAPLAHAGAPAPSPNASRTPAAAEAAMTGVEARATAAALADWARHARNPVALALAGRMLESQPATAMETPPPHSSEVDVPVSATPKDAPAAPADGPALIAEARTMAGGDRDTLKAIDSAVASVPASVARGHVGGPQYICDQVQARSTDRWRMMFRANELAVAWVNGDGDTDLDCWVYDENGNLIASDTDYTDSCLLQWRPAWTGEFTLRIQNFGDVWNGYCIETN